VADGSEQMEVVVTATDAEGALEDAASEMTDIIGSASGSGGDLYVLSEAVTGLGSVTGEGACQALAGSSRAGKTKASCVVA